MKIDKKMVFQYIIAAIAFVSYVSADECFLYVAPSTTEESGRGLFAGTNIRSNRTFAEDSSIVMHEAHSFMGGLRNYVHPIADTDRVALHLGSINFVNSAPEGPIRKAWLFDDIPPHSMSLPYSDFYPRAMYSRQQVEAGQELFTDYGSEWFEGRRIRERNEADNSKVDMATLQHVGVCLTDTHVTTSTIPAAHLGLFASRDFESGELITVSPVLLLSMKNVDVTTRSSSLINYVLTEPESPVGILPLGNVAMMNHGGREKSNVFLAWFDWTDKTRSLPVTSEDNKVQEYLGKSMAHDSKLEHLLQMSVKALSSQPFAPLDIGVYANRRIAEGEELFLDYGSVWAGFVSRCVDEETQRLNPDYDCLHFRHAIEVSRGLFPSHWYEGDDVSITSSSSSSSTSSDNKSTQEEGKATGNNGIINGQQDEKVVEEVQKSAVNDNNNNLGGRFSNMFNNLFGRK